MAHNYSNTTLNSNLSTVFEPQPSLSIIWSVLILNSFLIVNYSIVAFVLTKHTKTFAGSYYVITRALAFCDMAILIVCMGYTTSRLGPPDKRPQILNILYYFDFGLGFFPSQYLNVIIGSNRFVAIVFFDKYKTVFTEYRSRILVCGAFLSSLTVEAVFFNTALFNYADFVYIDWHL
uniref:7TM GPCR serpentine receptor class x (Srx) domain-containing protein n=1 Tax=Romanomermis culicivorax TaxID=13658 RepID=A0A915IK70_ROMCU